jgi:hypothetical protein
MPGQQAPGLNLLNSAFSRAQEQAQQAQQAGQYQQTFNRQGEQFAQQQQNWKDTFDANQAEAARRAAQFDQSFGLQQQNATRSADQWYQDFGLRNKEFGLRQAADARAAAAAAADAAAGPAPPKLSPGYMYQPSPDGKSVIAAPIVGTPDYAKGMDKQQTLQSSIDRAGELMDLVGGKEQKTPAGNMVRSGGKGSEMFGDTAAKYSLIRGLMISDLGKLNDAGVLQEGEYARYSDMLRDPSSIGSYFTGNNTMMTGYKEFQDIMKKRLSAHVKANPWLMPKLPPGYQATE